MLFGPCEHLYLCHLRCILTSCRGGSVGHGVCKNTLTELVNHVFSDQTVWKKIGNTRVIDMMPVGITPDPVRLRLLKAYGYICMLHIILLGSLPIPISTVFMYAVLQPGADTEVLSDTCFLHASAPQELQLLERWPTKPADFMMNKDNENLKALTITYFDKSVRGRLHLHSSCSEACCTHSPKYWRHCLQTRWTGIPRTFTDRFSLALPSHSQTLPISVHLLRASTAL